MPALTIASGDEFDIGTTSASCCLVTTGRLALRFTAAEERSRTIGLLEEGDLLVRPVEAWAVVGPRLRCRALEESSVLLVERERLESWLGDPILAANVVRVLSAQVAERELAVAISLEPSVERRLLLKLRQLALRWGRVTPDGIRLDLRLTHQELASMVGAVRESITLALGRLAEQGEIDASNRVIVIRRLDDEAT